MIVNHKTKEAVPEFKNASTISIVRHILESGSPFAQQMIDRGSGEVFFMPAIGNFRFGAEKTSLAWPRIWAQVPAQYSSFHFENDEIASNVAWHLLELLANVVVSRIDMRAEEHEGENGFSYFLTVYRKDGPSLSWAEAEAHLKTMRQAYTDIGSAGLFALTAVINPLLLRYSRGERTPELYNEILDLQ